MNREEVRDYFLTRVGAYEEYPFDEDTAVYKVGNKMFGLMNTDTKELSINLKCEPDDAIFLRENHSAIIPGYHMNKKHWNTVIIDGSLTDEFIEKLIDDSYDLVIKKMTKKEKAEIGKEQ